MQSVGDAEDSGVGGNAQSDGNDDHHREAGSLHQGSNGVANVLQQHLHRWPPLGEKARERLTRGTKTVSKKFLWGLLAKIALSLIDAILTFEGVRFNDRVSIPNREN